MGASLKTDSASQIKDYLRDHGLAMRKRFGQNFLINRDAQRLLIDALELGAGETVWEVGPGLGTMTGHLLRAGADVRAFEVDAGFCRALREIFAGEKNFTLIEGDVLKTAFTGGAPEAGRVKLLGNLPYNIGARLLGEFIENNIFFSKAAVTVQREVAERIAGGPGSKNYSSISVLCGCHYDIKLSSVLKGGSFYPAPNVESQIVIFTLKGEKNVGGKAEKIERPECFVRLVRALFAGRRKTVKNNFKVFIKNEFAGRGVSKSADEINFLAESFLAECSIKENERAENLSIEDFLALGNCF